MCVALCAGCGNHAVTHSAPDETRPHLTWQIRAGSAEEEIVCASDQPRPNCLLSTGSPITVHIAFHAVKVPTTYAGQVEVPFIEGIGQGGKREVNATVPKDSAPVNTSITGIVISKPGSYSFRISVGARQEGAKSPAGRLSVDVPVIVR